MTRKRFVKLLMSCGIQRNSARRFAVFMRETQCPYLFAWISREMTLDEIEKELGYKVKIINKKK